MTPLHAICPRADSLPGADYVDRIEREMHELRCTLHRERARRVSARLRRLVRRIVASDGPGIGPEATDVLVGVLRRWGVVR